LVVQTSSNILAPNIKILTSNEQNNLVSGTNTSLLTQNTHTAAKGANLSNFEIVGHLESGQILLQNAGGEAGQVDSAGVVQVLVQNQADVVDSYR